MSKAEGRRSGSLLEDVQGDPGQAVSQPQKVGSPRVGTVVAKELEKPSDIVDLEAQASGGDLRSSPTSKKDGKSLKGGKG